MPKWRAIACTSGAVAALVALLPKVGHADPDTFAPAVDLEKISVEDQGAKAPLAEGGQAADLTLDPLLERAARRLLTAARPVQGAATVIDVKTGRLLAFAELTRKQSDAGVLLAARSPAASVFKLVTTTSLLERGEVDPTTNVCTRGGTRGIERTHLDAPRRGPKIFCGPFGYALGHSRNAAYAQLATHHLSRDELIDTARRFGFNQRLAFDAPVAMGTLDVPFNDLEFARTAAGFRGSTLSPLGAAHLAYTIAAGGQASRLRIVRSAPGYQAPSEREVVSRVTDSWTAHRLMRMMEVTVRDGTSAEAFLDPSGKPYLGGIRVAGKTGTLEAGGNDSTASWFTGFAPSRKPEIVVTVLLVNGSTWRRKANEVARDLFRVWFHRHGRTRVSDPFDDGLVAGLSTPHQHE